LEQGIKSALDSFAGIYNKEFLRAGLAWHSKRYSRDPELAKLETEVRQKTIMEM